MVRTRSPVQIRLVAPKKALSYLTALLIFNYNCVYIDFFLKKFYNINRRVNYICQTKKLVSKDTSLAEETVSRKRSEIASLSSVTRNLQLLEYSFKQKTRIQRYEFGRGDAILQPVVLVGNATLPFAKQKNSHLKIRVWQGRRDSNTQPTVLETATLPLSHSPKQRSYYITKKEICQLFLGHF